MIDHEHPVQTTGNGGPIATLAVHPLDVDPGELKTALDRRSANRDAILGWIRSQLKEGDDYGRIHTAGKNRCQYAAQYRGAECPNPAHWSKPQLFKPGSEKICGMLGLRAEFPSLQEYERMILDGKTITHVILRCILIGPGGMTVAEGVGARSLAAENGDLNKSLKMAEKSAMIDATLRVAGLSALFGQDMEDQHEDHPQTLVQPSFTHPAPANPASPAAETGTAAAGANPPPPAAAATAAATAETIQEVLAMSREAGISPARLAKWLTAATKGRTDSLADLTTREIDTMKRKLMKIMSEKPVTTPPPPPREDLLPDGYHVISHQDEPF